jgi:hypothetical protein
MRSAAATDGEALPTLKAAANQMTATAARVK